MGMIPAQVALCVPKSPCPHTHGDDPTRPVGAGRGRKLVPTRMGMIPWLEEREYDEDACPHTHGDDPSDVWLCRGVPLLSPHAWG